MAIRPDPRPIARHRPRADRHRARRDAGLVRRHRVRAADRSPGSWPASGSAQPGLAIRFDDGIEIELDLTVALGVPVAEVARQVDSAVRYAVRRALDREVARLAIHVDGLRVHPGGALPAPPAESARPRSGRATSPTAARTSPRWHGGPATATACWGPSGQPSPTSRPTSTRSTASTSIPVPDGDTGSNMLATVKAALEEAEASPAQPAERVAGGDQLRGAHGRPRQLGRHHQPDLPGHGRGPRRQEPVQRPGPRPRAERRARQTAYAAVAKPVEGTILTVIREVGRRRRSSRPSATNDIETVLAATVEAAEKVGRADAEPAGRSCARRASSTRAARASTACSRARCSSSTGKTPVGAARDQRHGRRQGQSTLVAHADEGFGYETMFLLQRRRHGGLDVDAIRDHLETIGESVLVAGDARALKVHVHNERPDLVIGYGLTLGTLSRISVENLDNQARDVRETRAAAFTGAATSRAAAARRPRPARRPTSRRPRRLGERPRPPRAARPRRHRRRRRRRARGDLPRLRRRRGRAGRPVGQPEHRRAARGGRGRARARGPAPAEQPERRPGRAPGRRR